MNYIHSIINQYLQYGYSLIPVDKEKRPCVFWKKYQYKRATINDILNWHIQFDTLNIGIVTGNISQLAVIDVDDLSLLPELKGMIPEITKTTRVKTNRGYHFYFYLNGNQVKSTSTLFGKSLELKSNGSYIIAPPSVIKNHHYSYEVPLSKILPIPEKLVKKNDANIQNQSVIFKIPKYHGKKIACIRQILLRELVKGERNNSLFILYNLLLQNKNTKDHARKIVIKKNQALKNPLSDSGIRKVCRKVYSHNCNTIRNKLSYIQCEHCEYRFNHGKLKESNLLIRNIRMLPELSNTQRGIACLLGTVFEGENPSINQIANTAKMNYVTVKKAIHVLKKKHIIDDSFYN